MPIPPRSISEAFGPADHKPLPTDTLKRALDKLRAGRWRDHRSKEVLYSQGIMAIEPLLVQHGTGDLVVNAVQPEDVARCIDDWLLRKVAPDTIRKRLNVLRAMGVDLGASEDRPKLSKKGPLKWWLSPSDEERLFGWCLNPRNHHPHAPFFVNILLTMVHYITFVTRTGLRVEEALALTPNNISFTFPAAGGNYRERASVTVMGTKTAGAHATLPLMPEAYDALCAAFYLENGETLAACPPHLKASPIFRFARTPAPAEQYREASRVWEACRAYLGQKDNPTATLKALRRSAARYLHITKGMPLDMVREYLRHEDIETTQGYLRLTGGYGEKEMRAWLTK